ncbi:DUF2442 domain-containing protein [candidate division KSB1 bacterium]|nr:MAG: DUF2442 domain-containing protein [candidate division KSB1 bacterium]MBC6951235.1 DUF2442 domain-containing protein [candidate division KSB1 bacterium]MCE7942127.1 DUF2442 domain-containing protein [Chlorobi bacterium CHB1]MDL1873979.1 DUF2442 domain-containing protein [Cytophagia bacterium CHB2]
MEPPEQYNATLYFKDGTPLENFCPKVAFRNGEIRVFDVMPYLNGPIFEPLHDPKYFSLVAVDDISGSIFGLNGADFCPDFVYSLPDVSIKEAATVKIATELA